MEGSEGSHLIPLLKVLLKLHDIFRFSMKVLNTTRCCAQEWGHDRL